MQSNINVSNVNWPTKLMIVDKMAKNFKLKNHIATNNQNENNVKMNSFVQYLN